VITNQDNIFYSVVCVPEVPCRIVDTCTGVCWDHKPIVILWSHVALQRIWRWNTRQETLRNKSITWGTWPKTLWQDHMPLSHTGQTLRFGNMQFSHA